MIDSVYLSYKSELERKTGETKKWLDILLRTEEQYKDYILNFLIDLKRFSPMMDYRESRLKSQKTTFEDFEKHYLNNKRRSLEDLFLEPIEQRKVDFLEERIGDDSISLHILYKNHVVEPTFRIMRLLL